MRPSHAVSWVCWGVLVVVGILMMVIMILSPGATMQSSVIQQEQLEVHERALPEIPKGVLYKENDKDTMQKVVILLEELLLERKEEKKEEEKRRIEDMNRMLKEEEMRKKEEQVRMQKEAKEKEEVARLGNLPTVYIITPTFKRLEQIPELTRLGQTLLNVPKLHWIVAEDANVTNVQVLELLKALRISYTYLLTPMPEKYRNHNVKPKGVSNRNGGIDYLRKHVTEGVFYFADDDNTYDIRLFEEIRKTKKVSMFPVGLVTQAGLSTPVVKDGKFAGWYDGWIGGRKFPVDMACFAVSVPYLLTVPTAFMPFAPSFEETRFLESLKIRPEELEFLADNCTKIYAWHTKTQRNWSSTRGILDPKYDGTNLRQLQEFMTIKAEEKTS